MTHFSLCDPSHWFYQIFWIYTPSHLLAQFYTYLLVRQAVIWVLINVPLGTSYIPESILYCLFSILILGGIWWKSEWCRIRFEDWRQNVFHTAVYSSAVYCTVEGLGKNLCCRGFINIGCGPRLPLTACLIAWLHANRGECWLSGSFTPCYVMPDLIHCSEARVGIPSCTWK